MYLTHALQMMEIYQLPFHVMIVGSVVDGNPYPAFCTTSTRIPVTTIMELYIETDYLVSVYIEGRSMALVTFSSAPILHKDSKLSCEAYLYISDSVIGV